MRPSPQPSPLRGEGEALGGPGHGQNLLARHLHPVSFTAMALDYGYERGFCTPRLESAVAPDDKLDCGRILLDGHSSSL